MPSNAIEVERAAEVITMVGGGKKIERVETTEDTIVYTGVTHQEFVSQQSLVKVIYSKNSTRLMKSLVGR